MWIAGGICAIGTLYLGYKFVMDPLFIESIWSKNPTIVETGATPPMDPGPSNGPGTIAAAATSQVDPSTNQGIIRKVASAYSIVKYKLNPINWVTPTHENQRQFEAFMVVQNDMARSNPNYYPFTEYNPCDSWLKRLRIRWLGETTAEAIARTKAIAYASTWYDEIKVKGTGLEAATSVVNTTTNSPLLPGLGLPLPKPLTSGHTIWSAASSGANSPSVGALGLPLVDSPLNPTTTFPQPMPTVTTTATMLSKAGSVPQVAASDTVWTVNQTLDAEAGTTSLIERRAALEPFTHLKDPDRVPLNHESIPGGMDSPDLSSNRIPLESSID